MMNPSPAVDLNGTRVLVVGLGRFGGGVGVTRWLIDQGASVVISDAASHDSLSQSVDAVADLPVTLHLGGHDIDDLRHVDLAIINPAVVKHRSEFFQAIQQQEIPWTTAINLFCERCPARMIGITGTFGKSTTATMVAEILQFAQKQEAAQTLEAPGTPRVFLGGNIGRSLLADLSHMSAGDHVVLELSNAQLEDLDRIVWRPVAVAITNLYPHHLERHGSFDRYIGAKLKILGDRRDSFPVVVGPMHTEAETALSVALNAAPARIRRVQEPPPHMVLSVPGRHNLANAACALELCAALGVDDTLSQRAVQQFKGLPHRLQMVGEIDGVRYVNDSKATSPSATIAAVESFDVPIVAIVGGQGNDASQDASLAECATVLCTHCHAVVCTGNSAARFAAAIQAAATVDPPTVRIAPSLERAVAEAQALAQPGDVVLLAPGAPSFDAFANYAERGRRFTELVCGHPAPTPEQV